MANKTTKKAEPTLKELLAKQAADADALAAFDAEQAAAREAVAAQAAEAKANAEAAINDALAPFRKERDELLAGIANAKAARAEAVAPISAKYDADVAKLTAKRDTALAEATGEFDASVATAEEALAALEAKVEETTGIPSVVLNMDIAPKVAPKTAAKKGAAPSKAKKPKVADLGEIGPVTVEAPHRYTDGAYNATCVYETKMVDGVVVLFGKRVDHEVKGNRVIDEAALEGEYTHSNTSASQVISIPGWQRTNDALYALAMKAGVLGDFPEFTPESDAEFVVVDGMPLATNMTAPAEAAVVTIEETV